MTPNPTIRSRKSASHTEMSTKDGKLIELQDMDQVPEGDDPESRRQTLAHKQARAQLDPQTQDKSQEAEPKRDRFNSLWRISELTSVHLENKGSIARDHLSNERTFLAWVRTSATFLVISISVLQFFLIQEMAFLEYFADKSKEIQDKLHYFDTRKISRVIAIFSSCISIICLIFALTRYLQVQTLLMKDVFPATRISLFIVLVLMSIIIILALVLIIKIST